MTGAAKQVPPAVPMPPIVAAIAAFAHDYSDVPMDDVFVRAWRSMPAVVANIANGSGHEANSPNLETFVKQGLEAAAQEERENDSPRKPLVDVLEWIDVTEPDAMSALLVEMAIPSFWFGLAMALYLTHSPSMLMVHADGTATEGGGR